MLQQFGVEPAKQEDGSKDDGSLLKETLQHISQNSLLSQTMLKIKAALIENDTYQTQHELREQQLIQELLQAKLQLEQLKKKVSQAENLRKETKGTQSKKTEKRSEKTQTEEEK